MIKCSQCGFDNLPARLYCAGCKARLDLGQITREFFLNSAKHGAFSRKVSGCILLIIMVSLVLALWPARTGEAKISDTEFSNARTKLAKLQTGVAALPVEFSEKEVSILFNYLIRESRRRPDFKPGYTSLHASGVVINPGTLTFYLGYQAGPWMLRSFTIGPFRLTYKVTGRPERAPDGLRFIALNGAIGHLPLPVLGRNLGMARLKKFFLPFNNARSFLSGLKITEMKKGSITVFRR